MSETVLKGAVLHRALEIVMHRARLGEEALDACRCAWATQPLACHTSKVRKPLRAARLRICLKGMVALLPPPEDICAQRLLREEQVLLEVACDGEGFHLANLRSISRLHRSIEDAEHSTDSCLARPALSACLPEYSSTHTTQLSSEL